MKRSLVLILLVMTCFLLVACDNNELSTTSESTDGGTEVKENTNPEKTVFDVYDVFTDPDLTTPDHSDFFASVFVEDTASVELLNSDGDLWASAWSDDDALYTANGDGKGFGNTWHDIVLNKVTGTPYDGNLTGRLVTVNGLSQVWTDDVGLGTHNRKPTSMISVDGVLYMAVQDLNNGNTGNIFNEAPAATIIMSTDKGKTWQYDTTKPMFSNYKFTTIMFLDYGKDSSWNDDGYVYAYGLDNNWRDSFSNCVDDPQELFLARVAKNDIMDASKWEYYTGDLKGNASWSDKGDIDAKKPVLVDKRRVYNDLISGASNNFTVLGQGSIVYNKALNRYIYTSWTEYTYEFYEAEAPWGEWKHFYSKDFGRYPWDKTCYGGYATVIPSKYISEDGLTMYICSCTFTGGISVYRFSLRKMVVQLSGSATPATNRKSNNNLGNYSYSNNPTAICRASDAGLNKKINDLVYNEFNSSYTGCKKLRSNDYWGYTFGQNYNFNELIYTVGEVNPDRGGWFDKMKVQVRQNGIWVDVTGLDVSSNYTYDSSLESFSKIKITFNDIYGDGIRIIGIPGGAWCYTTIAELEVYYR